MSTVFFNDAVKVDINRGEEATVNSSGAELRNALVLIDNKIFGDSYRKYTNKNELLIDGFSRDDFIYKFADIYFSLAVDPYDRPSLLVSGGRLVASSSDYINKLRTITGETSHFGFVLTDISHRRFETTMELEFDFVLEFATYVETTEKFYAVHFDNEYIPEMLTWITTNKDEVVLTEKPYGLMTHRSLQEF